LVDIGNRNTLIQIDDSHCEVKVAGTKVAKAQNVTVVWGNTVNEEPTIGNDIPDQWTGKFHGVLTLDILYMTDLAIDTLSTPGADGQVPETTITGAFTNTEGTPKIDTWTIKARLNNPTLLVREQSFVKARVSGILTARPSKVQT
jgi:hypothetical protein